MRLQQIDITIKCMKCFTPMENKEISHQPFLRLGVTEEKKIEGMGNFYQCPVCKMVIDLNFLYSYDTIETISLIDVCK